MKKDQKITIFINEKLCKGVDSCGLCIHVCPKDVYERDETLTERGVRPPKPVHIHQCTECMLCMIYCPDFAIVVKVEKRKERSVNMKSGINS